MPTAATRPYAAPLAVGVAALVSLTACSGSSSSSGANVPAVASPAASASAAASADSGSKLGAAGSAAAPGGARPAQAPLSRKIIRKATVSTEVTDLGAAAAKVRAAATSAGGYVGAEDMQEATGAGESASDHLTVQVPVEKFDSSLGTLAGIGTVQSRSVSSEDVTGAVADTDSRVKTLRASVDRTRALMSKATSISDITALESELSRREGDLEAMQAQLRSLSAESALSTIDVYLTRPGTGSTAADQHRQDGFGAGWDAGISAARHLLVAVAAILGFLLPLAVPLLLVGGVAWIAIRRLRRRRAARRASSVVAPETVGATKAPGQDATPGPDRT